jgi:hypothetical protein
MASSICASSASAATEHSPPSTSVTEWGDGEGDTETKRDRERQRKREGETSGRETEETVRQTER